MPILGSGLIKRGIAYLLRVEFTTDDSAPMDSPYIGEVGSLTSVQNDGQYSVASGEMTFPVQTTPAATDQGFYSTSSIARVAGRVLIGRISFTTRALSSFAWANAQTVDFFSGVSAQVLAAVPVDATDFRVIENGQASVVVLPGLSASTNYDLALVLFATGGLVLIKGGAFTDWRLLWLARGSTTTPLYPAFGNYTSAGKIARVVTWDTALTSLAAVATLNVASPTGTYTGTADQLLDLTVTAPGSITQECGVKFRIVDANNYLWMGFTTAGRFQLRRYTSGSPTNLIDVASVAAAGGTHTIRTIMSGSTLDCYSYNGAPPTKRGALITEAQGSTQTGIEIQAGDWTVADLRSLPLTSSAYTQLSNG